MPDEIVKLNCAVYVRVSTEEQAAKGYSIDEQVERCVSWCKSQGHEVVGIYKEEGRSGKDEINRPEYQRMMSEKEKWDMVVFWKLDRIHRSVMNWIMMVSDLEKVNKRVASVTENIDTSNYMGRFVANLFSLLAQMESERLADRVKMGMSARAMLGQWITRPPYGYDMIVDKDENSHLIINQKESEIIIKIYKLHHEESYTPHGIAIYLNANQIPTKSGKKGIWTQTHIINILDNPVYRGKLRIRHKSGETEIRQGEHDPIIPEDVAQRRVLIFSEKPKKVKIKS